MARQTERHGPMSPAEVDAMDITVVAALLGVGGNGPGDMLAQAQEMTRRRMAAAARNGDQPLRWGDISDN